MAAAGSAQLLRAASAGLGRPACRWRLLAGPRTGAGAGAAPGRLPGRRGPGLGGGAGASRPLSTSAPARSSSEDKITVHFINRDGQTLTTEGKIGDSLLDVVIENNLDIDGFGACEGTLACSTCHLIFEDHIYEKLDAITDEENDMLDLAYGLTDRSRLGCQICLTKSMDNMTVRVPDAVADARQSVDMERKSHELGLCVLSHRL
uniref:Adrenal ferredoxin n=1 Tax=Castor canadensis TaxID=51338 RepID=A0A8C0ZP62_CASCN